MKSLLIYMFSFCFLVIAGCKEEEQQPAIETGTMADVDGNTYTTVKVGNSWWMAENLRVTHYRDGSPITRLDSDIDWLSGSAGYSVHPEATTLMGNLYNWAAVSNSIPVAPDGWHIATDEEWKQLELDLGMSSSAANALGWRGGKEGDALKATGTVNWARFDPVWADNSSGFSALSGSCRIFDGRFGTPGKGYAGFWWTSSASTLHPDKAYYRYLDYKRSSVFRQTEQVKYGFSVRCVKD
ncbi:MAG: fibrobacter succinogenes major paralogous domain-containing protein [Bacteroidota bacterium]